MGVKMADVVFQMEKCGAMVAGPDLRDGNCRNAKIFDTLCA
jgi:hypothetical protein